MVFAFFIMLLSALIVYAPDTLWQYDSRDFIIIVGAVGIWRYSWGFTHFVRSWYFRRFKFRKLRKRADRLYDLQDQRAAGETAHAGAAGVALEDDLTDASEIDPAGTTSRPGRSAPAGLPSMIFLVITSFRIRAETTAAVYRAAFAEAARCTQPITIIASIVELADQRFIKQVFYSVAPPEHVNLVFVRLNGRGKRDALAIALNTISRQRPPSDAVVGVMDGDTVLPQDSLRSLLPFFAMLPDMGGLTTDQDSVTDGTPMMAAWHRLRFAQRQVLMSSMALSGKLLTMTGRFSLYRLEIATNPDFIAAIRDDFIDHWRFGHLKLLTGEDKSTWFWLLKNRWKMFYVPDVRVWTIEHPPGRTFMESTTVLMMRWFGNMLRSSGRAIQLGPRVCGPFTWWCLIDQRLSMWTPLIGPIAALIGSIIYTPMILYVYLIWVMLTRLVQALMLLEVRHVILGSYPLLIYFSQVYGAIIKTYMLFRLNRQRWTRQNIEQVREERGRFAGLPSTLLHGVAMSYLVVLVGFLVGALEFPSASTMANLF